MYIKKYLYATIYPPNLSTNYRYYRINKSVFARADRLVAPLRLSRGQRLLADFAEAEQ